MVTPGPIKILLLPVEVPAAYPIKTLEFPALFEVAPIETLLELVVVLVAPAHSLEYLRSYGFRTFAPYIDESYDLIEDDVKRIERVTHILLDIQARSAAAKIQLHQDLLPIVEHNYNHFYRGGFRDVLEAELKTMLTKLCGVL